MKKTETPTPGSAEYFKVLRFEAGHHVGLGDIRLTMSMQNDIAAELEKAQKDLAEMTALKEMHHGNSNFFAKELEQAQLPESTRTLLGHVMTIADHASDQAHECDCFKFSLSNFSDHACPFCKATEAAGECDIKDWARLIALADVDA